MRAWRRTAVRVVALGGLAFLASCGNDGDVWHPDDGFSGTARPSPEAFADGSEGNLPPPDEMLVPESSGRPLVPPRPLTAEEKTALGEEGLRLGKLRLDVIGVGGDDDLAVARLDQDEFGGVHVRLQQTYRGLPVLGGEMATHHPGDGGDHVSEALVLGLDLDVTPVLTEGDAQAAALALYGSPAGGPAVVASTPRLAVRPALSVVRADMTRVEDHTEDFATQLDGATLVYELTVSPDYPDLATSLSSLIAGATTDSSPDDPTGSREANAVRAGNETEEPASQPPPVAYPDKAVRYEIDAKTGALVSQTDLVENDWEDEEDVGYGYLSGRVDLDAVRESGGAHWLMDTRRTETPGQIGNVTLDGNNLESHSVADMDLITDLNGLWGDYSLVGTATALPSSTRRQTPAVDIHRSVGHTWDMFRNVLGRFGFDGQGGIVIAVAHWGDEYKDAHYNRDSGLIVFGDGATDGSPGNYSLQTVAHELGHKFWHACGHASQAGESSALNEGHGDVQGGLVGLYKTTGNGHGSLIRRLDNFANWRGRVVNPAGYSEDRDSVTYFGLSYWSSTLKDGPEHVGGLPFGRAMIYLAEGAPSDSADTLWTTEYPAGLGGVGTTTAAHIWKTAITSYLVGTPTYAAMRTAFEDAAKYLHGNGSMEVKAVRRAFAAIRVGAKSNDLEDPAITYAKVYDVNVKDMTARIYATATDDTGLRGLTVSGNDVSYHREVDHLHGYHSILREPAGQRTVAFTLTDSDGKTRVVNRSFAKTRHHSLLVNGDFEDGPTGWTTTSGDDPTGDTRERAFLGEGYAVPRGSDAMWQEVSIPPAAETATLVFRALVRDSTQAGERMYARIRSAGGTLLSTLATFDVSTPPDTRTWFDKGYARHEFDLGAYVGQTIRISFENEMDDGIGRIALDQVVVTYTEDVVVSPPVATVRAFEDTVAFTCPSITGVTAGEIGRVEYWVDGELAAAATVPWNDWYAARFLSPFGPGAHWVGVLVKNPGNAVIGQSGAVWFQPAQVNELLVNRGFESGPWDLTYSDLPPEVLVVQDVLDSTISFQGDRALRMGFKGSAHTSQAGQVVHVPHGVKTLTFSARIQVASDEVFMGPGPDRLRLELWNGDTYQKISEHHLADSNERYDLQGSHDLFGHYWRAEVSLPPGPYVNKNVIVLLKVVEDASLKTSFYVDNASLRYTLYGLQLGN